MGGGVLASGAFLLFAFGLDYSFGPATALAAIVGGSAWFLGQRLLPGPPPVPPPAPLPTPEELVARGSAQAAEFGRLSLGVRDPELRRRVAHIGERLRELFAELARKPHLAHEAEGFVTDFLPRALTMVEHYASLSARLGEHDPRLAEAAHTVNTVADAVKATHRQLFEEELTEFAAASRTLEQEIRLMHPTLVLGQPRRPHE